MPGKKTQAIIILVMLAHCAMAQGVPDSSGVTNVNNPSVISQDSTDQGGNISLSVRDSTNQPKVKAEGNINLSLPDSLNTGGGGRGFRFNIRSVLNKISFNFNVGYGRTFYSHKLDAFGAIRDPAGQEGLYLFYSGDYNPASGNPQSVIAARNWLNNPGFDDITINPEDTTRMILGDSMLLKFHGNSASIPVSLTLFYSFLDRFRVGGGATIEFARLPVMSPVKGEDILGKYVPDEKNAIFLRYYGMVGGKLYERFGWTYYADIEIGKLTYLTSFNYNYVSNHNGLYFNFGFPMEYEFSEYLRFVVRPSFEYKSYALRVGSLGTVNHQYPAVYLTFGFRYNIPEAPRCPLHASHPPGYDYPKKFTNKTCRIRIKHYHNGKLYRGQPFYKPQNPDVGQGYKEFSIENLLNLNKRKISGGY